jgi:lipopolysaccharide transport system permease protein
MATTFDLLLKPRAGWQPINWNEIWLNRQLLGFLIWRDIKIRYRQTLFGGLWAVIQPLFAMLIFTFFFHRLSGISSGGPPYPLFAYAGLAFWTFFSNAVGMASNSLVGNQVLISKVYFPRIFIPLGSIGALLLDLVVSSLLMLAFMVYYRWPLSKNIIWLPVIVMGCCLAASGLGLIFSAWNVRFRDVKYAVPFFLQMGMFLTPVIYPLDYVPARLRPLMALNPMTGVVVAARYAFLGSQVEWNLILISLTVSLALFVAGLFVFRRTETRFADII